MRFEQLKRQPNAILRKKLYKSGKSWVIASTLAFAGEMILLGSAQGTTVKANVTDGVATEGTAIAPSNIGGTDGSNTETEVDSGSTKTEAQPTDANSDKGTGDSAGTTPDSTGSGNGIETTSNTDKTQASAVPANGSINDDNTDTVQSDDTGINDPNNFATSIVYGNVGANNDFAGSSWYINHGGVLHIGAGTWGDINGFNWGNDPSKVKSLYFDGPVTAGSSISGLFSGLTNLSSVGNMKGNFDTSKTESFDSLFERTGLTSYVFSTLDMRNAMVLSRMFFGSAINTVNLSSSDFPDVRDYSHMFQATGNLGTVNLSNFNFHDSEIESMFQDSALNSIDLSNINTSEVSDFSLLFDGDTNLAKLDLSDLVYGSKNTTYYYKVLKFLDESDDEDTVDDVKIHSLTLNPTLNLADSGLVFNTNLYKGWVSDKNPTADPISSEELVSKYNGATLPEGTQTWTLAKRNTIDYKIDYFASDSNKLITSKGDFSGLDGKDAYIPALSGYANPDKLILDYSRGSNQVLKVIVDPVKPYNLTVNISYDDNPKKDTQLLILPGNPEDISNDSVFQSDLDKLPNNNQTLDLNTTTFDLSTFIGSPGVVNLSDFAEALKL